MNYKKDAFPNCKIDVYGDGHTVKTYYSGMSLADYFAAKAMQAIISGKVMVLDPVGVSKIAYEYAGAMMKARFKYEKDRNEKI